MCNPLIALPHVARAMVLLVSTLLCSSVAAEGADKCAVLLHPHTLVGASKATLQKPLRLRRSCDGSIRTPVWTHQGLWTRAPRRPHGLATVERAGHPTYDPDARAWIAAANGSLVRVQPDGRLIVLTHGLQGIDVDARASRGVAVSREPDHTIVLTRFAPGGRPCARRNGPEARRALERSDQCRASRRVLLRGSRFFGPRLSRDGTRVLVSESRAAGGHTWVVPSNAAAGAPRDLGQSYDAAWHPDGRSVIVSRVRHDGSRITAADLWTLDARGRAPARRLTRTPTLAEIEPAISPAGTWIAFVDAGSGDLYLARLPGTARRGGDR